MNRPRDHFGPPYTDAELQEEAARASDTAVTPEDEELADYLAGALDDAHRSGIDLRLETDAAYRAWAAPLLVVSRFRRLRALEVLPGELARRRKVVRDIAIRFFGVWIVIMLIPILLILKLPQLVFGP